MYCARGWRRKTYIFSDFKILFAPCWRWTSFFQASAGRAVWKPVYSTQISNWLANVNFYSVAMGYHVVWFDTELQTVLISSIQFCPSLCITEPSGHLPTNKPLMAIIFRDLSLWHGKKCLHLSTGLDMLLVSHQTSSFTEGELAGVETWPNAQC